MTSPAVRADGRATISAPAAPGPVVRVVTVGAVLLVAAVAAVVSYAHMREVAARAGEGWRALLLPLSVDDGPRVFRTAVWWLFHAVCCRFRYSLWTSSGVL